MTSSVSSSEVEQHLEPWSQLTPHLNDAGKGLRLQGALVSYSVECSWHIQCRISLQGLLQPQGCVGIGKTAPALGSSDISLQLPGFRAACSCLSCHAVLPNSCGLCREGAGSVMLVCAGGGNGLVGEQQQCWEAVSVRKGCTWVLGCSMMLPSLTAEGYYGCARSLGSFMFSSSCTLE